MHQTGEQKTDMLRLLTHDSNYQFDFNELDTMEWTAFERAAGFGTQEDIQTLLDLGADPLICRLPLQWSPIFYSVDEGNWGTFNALLPRFVDGVAHLVDNRGWSLLHIAARTGRERFIRYLLQNGSDPGLQCRPSRMYVKKHLFDRRLTPGEIAEASGERASNIYKSVLHDLATELNWDDFWDAKEEFEILG
jgi:hypothetical protein